MATSNSFVFRISLIMFTERKKKRLEFFYVALQRFCGVKKLRKITWKNIGLKRFLFSWYLWFSDVSESIK